MNMVILIGRLTRDPESQGEGDSPRTKFSVAIDRQKEGVDFISCTAFGNQAENILKYCKKGTMVSVEGSLNSYSFENDEGERISGMNVTARRVQFLSRPSNSGESEESTPAPQTKAEERAEEQQLLQQAIDDFGDLVEESDLPF
jgi:single-strand DNA-binding protein